MGKYQVLGTARGIKKWGNMITRVRALSTDMDFCDIRTTVPCLKNKQQTNTVWVGRGEA